MTTPATTPASPAPATPKKFGTWIKQNWLTIVLVAAVIGFTAFNFWPKGEKEEEETVSTTEATAQAAARQAEYERQLEAALAAKEVEVATKAAAAAQAAKVAELEHKLAAKEAEEIARIEARKNLKPINSGGSGTEVLLATDGDMLKDVFLGWDTKSVPGYRVPLIKNERGNPAPIIGGPRPFPLAPVGTDWVKVKYAIPTGVVYDAWATKEGPSS